MKKMTERFNPRRLLALLMALMMVFTIQLAAFADDSGTYYATWDEFTAAGNTTDNWNVVADAMDAVFDHASELYAQGDADGAYDWVNNGYYGWYETTGFERIAMGYIAGSRKTEVELQFAACKTVTKNGGSQEEFDAELDELKSMIHTDANILDGVSDEDSSDSSDSSSTTTTKSAAAVTFAGCFSILLREGFEAILIIGAIIAYISKAGYEEKKKKNNLMQVYIGCALGVIMSFVLAWLLNELKLANSARQEIIEGVTALIAVVVLYYVSNWMLGKSESAAWSEYIMSKADDQKNGAFAMAFTAFLAVFREGAEVVLFYQPMLAQGETGSVWAGFAVGCVALVFVYIAITQLGLHIPIRFFFTAMSLIMAVMSISFLGAGIKELIEGDVFTMISPSWLQWIPTNDTLDVLGIYPTLQTLIPQLILIVITVIMFRIRLKKNKEIRIQQAEKKAIADAEKAAAEKKAADEALEAKITEVILAVMADPDGARKKLAAYQAATPSSEGE